MTVAVQDDSGELDWKQALSLLTRPQETTPDAVACWLENRQKAVHTLQSIDAQALGDDERQRLWKLLEQVRQEDEALVADLRTQQNALKAQLTTTLQNKSALQGYRLDPAVRGRTHSVKA